MTRFWLNQRNKKAGRYIVGTPEPTMAMKRRYLELQRASTVDSELEKHYPGPKP